MEKRNYREERGKDKIMRKPKRNGILMSRLEKISRRWSIISNVGEGGETKEYLSIDPDRKVFKTLTKTNA